MSAAAADAAARCLADQLTVRGWRELAAEAPDADRLTHARSAAALILLPLDRARQALVLGATWGRLAVPLARRLPTRALATSAARGRILARVASAERVVLPVVVGDLAAPPFAAGAADLVLLGDAAAGLDDPAAYAAALRAAAHLLAPGGALYVAGGNTRAEPAVAPPAASLAEYRARFAAAGLAPRAEYACFPDHLTPRDLVPFALLDAFLGARPDAAGGPAGERSALRPGSDIAARLAPAFAFVLGAAPGAPAGDDA